MGGFSIDPPSPNREGMFSRFFYRRPAKKSLVFLDKEDTDDYFFARNLPDDIVISSRAN